MAKVYQVEKQKKVERRQVKEGVIPEPVAETIVKKVEEPVVEKVVDSGEVKATPKVTEPKAKKKGRPKKKEK